MFLDRTYELAARGIGNTSPNPPVGAVIVRDGHVLGEGYHHRAGEPHAEVNALSQARDARGATIYVSLEPCDHAGRTPACTQALLQAGVARVVVGALDRSGHGNLPRLRERGVEVVVADDEAAHDLIEIFSFSLESVRTYVALKMAMSLDGYVTSRPRLQEWITGEEERLYVRDLRIVHDAVMVGAGTVRVDDPQLTVRPPGHRLRDFVRVVACERESVPPDRRVFSPQPGYARTIVLAPAGARSRFTALEAVADVLYIGEESAEELDLPSALQSLRERGIQSVLCEGGPTLAGRLVANALVDRFYWAIAPVLLRSDAAVPVLAGADLDGVPRILRFDRVERFGRDLVISGALRDV
ncbi:MAG TPA: bifunctional diaminohydroxyphosphoribosylaminopyrimidine deaminase/5-amino-6-(5-phosphoribosylamino)uracil reductase RibD [Candidatus Tyrphobacter sp.]